MKYKVITCVRNTPVELERCLSVLSSQESGQDFDVCVVDDASTDNTPDIAEAICDREGWTFIRQDEWKGALWNQVQAINAICNDPEDVVVFCDGDDRLARRDTFKVLDRYYEDGAKVTFGSYRPDPPDDGCTMAFDIPQRIKKNNLYRKFILPSNLGGMSGGHFFNHLRTFQYGLFEQLDESDFTDDSGKWFTNTPDTVLMLPCMELARGAVVFVPEVLLLYSSDLPTAEWRNIAKKVDHVNLTVLRRPPKC